MAKIWQLLLTYLILPMTQKLFAWLWDLWNLRKENEELKKKNEDLIKKFKESNGENSLNDFGNMP